MLSSTLVIPLLSTLGGVHLISWNMYLGWVPGTATICLFCWFGSRYIFSCVISSIVLMAYIPCVSGCSSRVNMYFVPCGERGREWKRERERDWYSNHAPYNYPYGFIYVHVHGCIIHVKCTVWCVSTRVDKREEECWTSSNSIVCEWHHKLWIFTLLVSPECSLKYVTMVTSICPFLTFRI